jgi:hypothetical protein
MPARQGPRSVHSLEMPTDVQALVGSVTDGLEVNVLGYLCLTAESP